MGSLQGSPFRQRSLGEWQTSHRSQAPAGHLATFIPEEPTGTSCRLREPFKLLHLLHTPRLETGPGSPQSLQIATSNWLCDFVILAGNQGQTKSNLGSVAETGRHLACCEPPLNGLYPFSLSSSPAFQAETSLLFPEMLFKGSEVFLCIILILQGATLLLCKTPCSALLKLTRSGIPHFARRVVQK